jgi:hypothetical protein
MRLKNLLFGISLLGLVSLSNNVFSQDFESVQKPIPNPKKFKPGAELGAIINEDTRGISFSLYYSSNRMQLGLVAETNIKYKLSFLDDGIDLLKCGVEAEYFPTNFQIFRPYIGSEVKYEHESFFVSRENRNYTKKGIGLEMKVGTEFKPLKYRNIKLFLESGYNMSIDKNSKGYPEKPGVKRDKFITVAGIKFG